MSIFVRPDSPPPRQPSPDIPPTPLPYPHHPRRVASQPKIRIYSPSHPPGLQSPTKTIQPVRSHDHMTKAHSDHNSFVIPMMRTRSTSRTQHLSPSRSALDLGSRRKSTLTMAVPRCSSVHVYPVTNPPLPPAPAALDLPSVAPSSKRTLRLQPNSFDAFYLDGMGGNSLPQRKPPSKPALPPLERHKSLGMACLRLFRLRNPS
ncbi:hypothetical protein BYT27DRAFT_7335811 [Phlegmacium glaucopus]|nr:hypothetical protein BYT27DRAFT_7335811 [Phlegmacium glaucopus]